MAAPERHHHGLWHGQLGCTGAVAGGPSGCSATADGVIRCFTELKDGQTRVPDLTALSKNNGGVFPLSRVCEIIDGRQGLKAHGTRAMPIWGQAYRQEGAEHHRDLPALCTASEAYACACILALAESIHRLQQSQRR